MRRESERVRPWTATRARTGLRLTAAERRYLLVLVDLLLVNGALVAAVVLWNDFPFSISHMLAYYKWFVTLSVVWLGVGTVLDVYNLARSASTTSIAVSAGVAALLTAIGYLSIPWLTPPILHRTYALGFVLLCASAILAWRVLYAQALVQPSFRRRALVLGVGGHARSLVDALRQSERATGANPFRGTGYQVVGVVADRLERLPDDADALPVLGEARQLVRLVRQHDVDEVVFALDDEDALSPEIYEVLLDCRELGLQVSPIEAVYERLTGRLPVDYARRDVRLLLSPMDSPGSRLYGAAKRLMDILLALLGLGAMVQVLPAVALANAFWSPGPLFYRQQRVGKGGRPIAVLKFRSMVPNAEEGTGAVWCGDCDSRITLIGRVLRKTRLDELPQLVNVLRGEMSIVGPRPERPGFVGQLARALPLYRARHAVKPGITGWAQVCYRYGSSVEDSRVKLEYDLYYVKHASLAMDLLVLLHTVRVVLGFKGR